MPSGVRRRKTDKSSIGKVSRRNKTKHRKIRIASNPIIAQHWDPKLTLSQNYKKIGLTSRLAAPSGGSEKVFFLGSESSGKISREQVLRHKKKSSGKLGPGEGSIERDADGNVVRIIYGKEIESEDEDDVSKEEWHGFSNESREVISKLEELSRSGESKPHVPSEREEGWLHDLISKYGDDYEAMKWDKKLNPFQQSSGDLKRRISKLKSVKKINQA